MVYWYLWWAGAALLMVSLVVVMAEDLLLVEVLGLSVTVVVELDLFLAFRVWSLKLGYSTHL